MSTGGGRVASASRKDNANAAAVAALDDSFAGQTLQLTHHSDHGRTTSPTQQGHDLLTGRVPAQTDACFLDGRAYLGPSVAPGLRLDGTVIEGHPRPRRWDVGVVDPVRAG